MKKLNVKNRYVLILLMPALLLTGCAASSPIQAVACPQIPSAPVVNTSLQSPSHSENARQDIQKWQQSLTKQNPTPKP